MRHIIAFSPETNSTKAIFIDSEFNYILVDQFSGNIIKSGKITIPDRLAKSNPTYRLYNTNLIIIGGKKMGVICYNLVDDNIAWEAKGIGQKQNEYYYYEKGRQFCLVKGDNRSLKVFNVESGNLIKEMKSVDQIFTRQSHFNELRIGKTYAVFNNNNLVVKYKMNTSIVLDVTSNWDGDVFCVSEFRNGVRFLFTKDGTAKVFVHNSVMQFNAAGNNGQEFLLLGYEKLGGMRLYSVSDFGSIINISEDLPIGNSAEVSCNGNRISDPSMIIDSKTLKNVFDISSWA